MLGQRDYRDVGGRRQSYSTFHGMKGLRSLAKGVVSEEEQLSENIETNYLKEEENIFNLNAEISKLIENLEKRKNNNETEAQ